MEWFQNSNKKSGRFKTSQKSDKITNLTKRKINCERKGRRPRYNPKGQKGKEQENDPSDQENPQWKLVQCGCMEHQWRIIGWSPFWL